MISKEAFFLFSSSKMKKRTETIQEVKTTSNVQWERYQRSQFAAEHMHYGYTASYVTLYWLVTSGQMIYKWPIST